MLGRTSNSDTISRNSGSTPLQSQRHGSGSGRVPGEGSSTSGRQLGTGSWGNECIVLGGRGLRCGQREGGEEAECEGQETHFVYCLAANYGVGYRKKVKEGLGE